MLHVVMCLSSQATVVSLCLLSGILLVQSQMECPDIEPNEVESLIRASYGGISNPDPPTIVVASFNVVCRAVGTTLNMYRFLSIVATYSCSGSMCEDSSITAQFDTECVRGMWKPQVKVFSDDEIRTEPADGNAATALRRDCYLCLSSQQAVKIGLTTDQESHCLCKLVVLS